MTNQNSKNDSNLQLKEYIKATFRYYLSVSSTIHMPSILCLNKSPLSWDFVVQVSSDYSNGYVDLLISFIFWDWSVNCWSVFCLFIDLPYLWKLLLRLNLYIVSYPSKSSFLWYQNFSNFQKLTIKVMMSAFLV